MKGSISVKLTEETIKSEPVYDGAIIKVTKDTVMLENGKTAQRDVVLHGGAACVVPVDEDGMVYMVRQYRYPFQRVMLEIPAGKLDKGETHLQAAKRELEEEIGMQADEMIYMGEFYPSVAYLTEIIHMYVAKGLTPTKQALDEDEFINVEKISMSELRKQIMNNEIGDGKTIAALLKADIILNS